MLGEGRLFCPEPDPLRSLLNVGQTKKVKGFLCCVWQTDTSGLADLAKNTQFLPTTLYDVQTYLRKAKGLCLYSLYIAL